MTSAYDRYRAADLDLPDGAWAWNLWGAGEDNMGKDDGPELLPIPRPDADHMLVRIDSVGLCFSDVKIMRQGGSHPKLYNRDLAHDPTRLGHEVSLTVIEVGDNLQDRYHAGQRLAVQPDIYQDGKSTAYGYTIPGGLIQYHLMGAEMLETDDGACLLPLPDSFGYAEASTLEPWGCVMAAYTQRRRLEPQERRDDVDRRAARGRARLPLLVRAGCSGHHRADRRARVGGGAGGAHLGRHDRARRHRRR